MSMFNYLEAECASVGQVILYTPHLSHKRLLLQKQTLSKVTLRKKTWLCKSKIRVKLPPLSTGAELQRCGLCVAYIIICVYYLYHVYKVSSWFYKEQGTLEQEMTAGLFGCFFPSQWVEENKKPAYAGNGESEPSEQFQCLTKHCH